MHNARSGSSENSGLSQEQEPQGNLVFLDVIDNYS